MITSADVAWLAGFIEGSRVRFEFSIIMSKGKRYSSPQPRIIITAKKCEDSIARVAKMFGTAATDKKTWGSAYHTSQVQTYGYKAIGWAMTILPMVSPELRGRIIETLNKWEGYPPMDYKGRDGVICVNLKPKDLVGAISGRGEFSLER